MLSKLRRLQLYGIINLTTVSPHVCLYKSQNLLFKKYTPHSLVIHKLNKRKALHDTLICTIIEEDLIAITFWS